jgi:DNA-binding HxlR family transcriptional regulator
MSNNLQPIEIVEAKAGCIEAAMDIIGSKWTALILRDLASGPKGFCEVERLVGGINPRTLSQRLNAMEEQGIIVKNFPDDSPLRGNYVLTQKGHDLIPVLQQMAAWGQKYQRTDTAETC